MVNNNETGENNPLDIASTEDLLGALSRRLAKLQTPEAKALIGSIQGYTGVQKPASNEAQLGNPEDEFVAAVKDLEIYGKFPQGLTLAGKELVPPTPEWFRDFIGFGNESLRTRLRSTPIPRLLNAIWGLKEDGHSSSIAKTLLSKHFLTIVPYPSEQGTSQYNSLLVYTVFQDSSIVDARGRYALCGELLFLMPQDKAQAFIKLIEDRGDGADITERFIQKAAPGVMATRLGEPGVNRVQASELVIIDEPFQRNFMPNELLQTDGTGIFSVRALLGNVEKAPIKSYSQPVGFGKPPS